MPDKPLWLGRLDVAIVEIEASDDPYIATAELRRLLRVGQRRAQQIMGPFVHHAVGRSGLARRKDVVNYFRSISGGGQAAFERRRIERMRGILQEARSQPRILVDVSEETTRGDMDGLPEGVLVAPGQITLQFTSPEQALEKLVALAMAVANDMQTFRVKASLPS
jgi:hypothetical protein